MKNNIFTIENIKQVGYNLEPLTSCIFCNEVGEVTYHQYVGDAFCSNCGKWQEEEVIKYEE